MKICTIGHSSLGIEEFIQTLRDQDVAWIADVRSVPHSGRFPHFNRAPLESALKRAGIRYLFLGDKVGGKPRNGETASAWTQGKLNPALVSGLTSTQRWSEGMLLLRHTIAKLAGKSQIGCLMCSEADPNNCHRSLISFQLEQMLPDLEVNHVRAGSGETEVRFQKTLFAVADDRSDYH